MLDEDEEDAILLSVPNSLSEVTAADCPLILTFTKLLSMIDNSFPNPFLEEFDWNAEGGDLGALKRDTILFIMHVLINNIWLYLYRTSVQDRADTRRKEVDFSRFTEVYYRHFDQRITSIVDAATVRLLEILIYSTPIF